MNFSSELKRRNVYKVAVAYAVAAWLIIQAASIFLPAFNAPQWAMQVVIVSLVMGFPIALAFSWAFEITPEGIVRETEVDPTQSITHHTGRKIIALTIVLGLIAAGLLTFQLLRARSTSSPSANALVVPDKSIAVLPFENLSDDKQNGYFSDGVQDEILSDLAKVADLKVISRTSVMQYKTGAPRNLREIGQQLGVAHLLEGSVQRAGNKVRVNAQLIDARTDAHLWAQVYDRPLDDVFAIQSEIAQAIADQLQAKLSPKEAAAMQEKATTDMAAYDLYLRAKEIEANGSSGAESYRREIALLDQAVTRDSSFVDALCLLAQVHVSFYWFGYDRSAARLELARKPLDAAARLNPDGGKVHLTRAIFYYRGQHDYAAALKELALARRDRKSVV